MLELSLPTALPSPNIPGAGAGAAPAGDFAVVLAGAATAAQHGVSQLAPVGRQDLADGGKPLPEDGAVSGDPALQWLDLAVTIPDGGAAAASPPTVIDAVAAVKPGAIPAGSGGATVAADGQGQASPAGTTVTADAAQIILLPITAPAPLVAGSGNTIIPPSVAVPPAKPGVLAVGTSPLAIAVAAPAKDAEPTEPGSDAAIDSAAAAIATALPTLPLSDEAPAPAGKKPAHKDDSADDDGHAAADASAPGSIVVPPVIVAPIDIAVAPPVPTHRHAGSGAAVTSVPGQIMPDAKAQTRSSDGSAPSSAAKPQSQPQPQLQSQSVAASPLPGSVPVVPANGRVAATIPVPAPAVPVDSPVVTATQAAAPALVTHRGDTATRDSAAVLPTVANPFQPAPAAPLRPVAQPAGMVFGIALAGTATATARADTADHGSPRDQALQALTAIAGNGSVLAAAPAGGASHGTLDMSRGDWPQAMIDHIEALRDAADATSTRIRLLPDALGKIDVSLRHDGSTVHVHFAAEAQATRMLIADAQPRLAEAAQARGIRLGQATVDAGTAGQGGQQHHATHQSARPVPVAFRAATPASDPSDSLRLA
jgi:Meckel syndrome type 1 protein